MTDVVSIRPAALTDIPLFVELQLDPESGYMAAFLDGASADVRASRWRDILADADATAYAILLDGQTIGYAGTFLRDGERELTYWIERAYWGRGIATQAVAELLRLESARPLYARVAADNSRSVRVLEKAGFAKVGHARGYAGARGCEIDELVFMLPGV